MSWTIEQAIILSNSQDPVLRDSGNRVLASEQKSMNWNKKNMFDGIGRPDLKPKKSTGLVEYINKLLRK